MTDRKAQLVRLAPYVVGRVRRGVEGDSGYAKRLRQEIHSAADLPA